ncbi:MAG: SDR family oxidoreductase [Chloroflexi bacterium]|nr:MAG: SDR family oxidoreductase [Chloroflexota bacterium]
MHRARPCRRPRQRGAATRAWCLARWLRGCAGARVALSLRAVVTGGSGGIGSEVVRELRTRRWDVISLSRREGCDISDEDQVVKAFSSLKSLDALVHCAAVLIKRRFTDMSAVEWDVQVASGLRGAFLCSREAFRLMQDRGGSIVFVSSLSGVAGAEKFPGMAAYVAAKSGLAGLTEALAAEGREAHIRVNAISPGAVDTPMLRIAGVEGPVLQPADVARIIVWLASAESAPLSGANLRMDP